MYTMHTIRIVVAGRTPTELVPNLKVGYPNGLTGPHSQSGTPSDPSYTHMQYTYPVWGVKGPGPPTMLSCTMDLSLQYFTQYTSIPTIL